MRLHYPPKTDNPALDVWLERLVKELEPLLNVYAKGDLPYASAANVLAALAIGTANHKLFINAAGDLPEWAVGIKIGTTTIDTATASGTQEISGIGFKPSHVILSVVVNATPQVSFGFDDGTLHYGTANYHGSAANQWVKMDVVSIGLYQAAGISYTGIITARGADGFTITWTKTGEKTGTASIYYAVVR